MPKKDLQTSESLHELEKIIQKLIRKNLKDNTLTYTVQFTRSNLEPGKTKYVAYIESPNRHVQPITFSYSSYEALKGVLEESLETLDRKAIEITFLQDRINHHGNIKQAYEERKLLLESGEVDIDDTDEDIVMEEV